MRDLDKRSKNDPDLFLPKSFHVLMQMTEHTIFMPKSSVISMNSYVLAFLHIKAPKGKFDFEMEKDQGKPNVIT